MSDSRSGSRIAGETDVFLLRQLKSADAGPAWTEFLRRYSSLLMKTANQFEYDQDRTNDCFLYVSEKLSENGFKRLLKYDSHRGASFRTWLTTVIFNLCVDWHRKEFGRVFLLPAISALAGFDQLVFRYSFELGMTNEECLHALSTEFPDVTRQQLSRAISRVHGVLTPRQRWQMGVRHRRKQRSRHPGGEYRRQDVDQLPALVQDPATMAQKQQELDALQSALAKLSARQHLLLYLRFHAGLTLDQIAQFTRLDDAASAWRHIDKALKALSAQFRPEKYPGLQKK